MAVIIRSGRIGSCHESMSLYGGIEIVGRPDLENVRKLDLLPMPMTARMMQYGMAIDKGWFSDLSQKLQGQMKELRAEICDYIPSEKFEEFLERAGGFDDDSLPMNVNSRDQLSILLFDVLGIGRGRQLKTTKSGDRISTGKKQMEQLKREHPIVQKTLNYAEAAKLKSTYTDALPKIAVEHKRGSCWCGLKHYEKTFRVHSQILWTRTDTGRPASKAPNLFNIPARKAIGREIRAGFVASPGTKLVASDFAQEEMRLGAHYSQDENLIRIFKEGLDPHVETAKRAFKTDTPDKLSQRDPCKNVNFGVFYELSGPGLYDLMAVTYATADKDLPEWLTIDWCKQFIEDWFELYPAVRGYLDNQHYRAQRYSCVWTLMGRVRLVPEVHSYHSQIRAAGLRQAGNHPIQGTGGDWLRLVLAEMGEHVDELERSGVWCWPLNCPYDEVLMEVEEDYAEYVKEILSNVMENVMVDKETGVHQFSVPIKVDAKITDRWLKE